MTSAGYHTLSTMWVAQGKLAEIYGAGVGWLALAGIDRIWTFYECGKSPDVAGTHIDHHLAVHLARAVGLTSIV
jgi:hypothetical protein